MSTPMKVQDEMATTCMVASVLISGYQIAMHLLHYNEPHIQLYIIRILMMIPVYSTATWLSVMIPKDALVFNTIRDIYEAYVLYIFMQLLIHFLGGENSLIVHLEFKRRIKQPWPLNGLKPLQTDKIFFRRVKQGVLQFVLIKPFTAVLAIIFENYGIYHEGRFEISSGYLYLSAINNVSISLSLYCLVLFYMATEERLKPFSPFAKFLCIKAILFFSFWQACAFTMLLKMNLVFVNRETANVAQSLIISLEMVFAAIAQAFAFNYRPFMEGARSQSENSVPNQESALRATGNAIKNMGYVLNVKDVLSDAHNTFIKSTEAKDCEQEMQMEDILKRDKAFNWSDEEIIDEKPGETIKSHEIEQRKSTLKNRNSTPAKVALRPQMGRSSLGAIQQQKPRQMMVAPSQYIQVKTNQAPAVNTHTGHSMINNRSSGEVEDNIDSCFDDEDDYEDEIDDETIENEEVFQISLDAENVKKKHSKRQKTFDIKVASNTDHENIVIRRNDQASHGKRAQAPISSIMQV